MDALREYIKSSPLVQAAITEAVHRFYFERIGKENEKAKRELLETQASDIWSTLWNLQPDWRIVLEKYAKRYTGEAVKWLPICSKPKNIIPLKIEIEIK